MILSAFVEQLKRRARDDFKGQHFAATLEHFRLNPDRILRQ